MKCLPMIRYDKIIYQIVRRCDLVMGNQMPICGKKSVSTQSHLLRVMTANSDKITAL